jgi:hypothetical protein
MPRRDAAASLRAVGVVLVGVLLISRLAATEPNGLPAARRDGLPEGSPTAPPGAQVDRIVADARDGVPIAQVGRRRRPTRAERCAPSNAV